MPRAIRNFWLILDVDGRKQRIKTGPRGKGGGFKLTILMRGAGAISNQTVVIRGELTDYGHLVVSADGGTTATGIELARTNRG